jgi:hypothetical protein
MNRRTARLLGFLLVVAGTCSQAEAGRGAAELSLDRAAVHGLLAAALPGPIPVALPGGSTVEIELTAPRQLTFQDGGVEAVVPIRFGGSAFRTDLVVRYVPDVEPLAGTVRLVAERVEPVVPLPFRVDLSSLLDPVSLPRRLDWKLELANGASIDVSCFVHAVEVGEERLIVELGLLSDAPR